MNNRQRQLSKIFNNPQRFGEFLMFDTRYLAYLRKCTKKFSTYGVHEKSFGNFDAIQKSKKCGCYFCGRIFPESEVEDWTSDETAFCPYCFNASIVQDYNVDITKKLLEKMNDEWFGGLRHVAGFGENAPKAYVIEID